MMKISTNNQSAGNVDYCAYRGYPDQNEGKAVVLLCEFLSVLGGKEIKPPTNGGLSVTVEIGRKPRLVA